MGAYENYTGPIYNPAGEQALAQAAANIGQTMGAAIEKRAAIERAEAERKRKEELAKAKERKAINQRIQAEAFAQTAAANKTLSNEIDQAGIDKKVFADSLQPMMDELGQLGARLKYDTNLSGKAYAEAKQRYGELYQTLNVSVPETLELLKEYADETKNAAEVAVGQEGGFDGEDKPEALYAKMVINGKIQGKFNLVVDDKNNVSVAFTGIEGMEPFKISADSLTRPNYNVIPKGSDMAATALEDANFNDVIAGYTTREGALAILDDAAKSGEKSGYIQVASPDGGRYVKMDPELFKSKAAPTLEKVAINIASDPLNAQVYYNNILSKGDEDKLVLGEDGQLTDTQVAKFKKAFVEYQGNQAYLQSNANRAIQIESAGSVRARQAAATETQKAVEIGSSVAGRVEELIGTFFDPYELTGNTENMQERLLGETLKGAPVTEVNYVPETGVLTLTTSTDKTITDVTQKVGEDPEAKTKVTTEEKTYTYNLSKKGKGYNKLLKDVIFKSTADQKLWPLVEKYMDGKWIQHDQAAVGVDSALQKAIGMPGHELYGYKDPKQGPTSINEARLQDLMRKNINPALILKQS